MDIRKLKQGWYVEAECKALVSEGLGLSHLSRKFAAEKYKPLTGFVWGVLPGERFVARISRVHGTYFHGVLAQRSELPQDWICRSGEPQGHERFALFNLAPQRREAPCTNFTLCGGCKLLHLEYKQTLEHKKNWLETHLQRNRVPYPEIKTEPSPQELYYRNHVQVHINARKERGFYAPYSYRVQPFPETGCLLFEQPLFDKTFPAAYELERCVRSRLNTASGKVLTVPLNSPADKNATFTYTINYPEETVTEITFPNTAFFQVNSSALPAWLKTIEQLLSEDVHRDKISVLELFSGFGFISRMLSYRLPLSIVAVDILKKQEILKTYFINNRYGEPPLTNFSGSYVETDLNNSARLPLVMNEVLQQSTFSFLLLNPPRGGLPPASIRYFMQHIRWEAEPCVIYSSCNAATFARDLACFAEFGLLPQYIKLIDFFPYTSHYEVVAKLTQPKNTR